MSTMTATRPALPASTGTPGGRARVWLSNLFAGEFPFPAIPSVTLPPAPRTAAEHDAVARAAGCRDLFVIHADPPAGERAIADLARATNERVLILSPNPAAADRIVEKLLTHGVTVLRALADDENPTRPSPAVSRVTSVAIAQGRFEQARQEAAAAVEAAEHRLAAFSAVAKAITRLAEVKEHLKTLNAQVAEQATRLGRVEAEVRAETVTPFATALAKLQTDHADTTARLTAELQALTASRAQHESALEESRRQFAEVGRKPGFLARLFGSKPASDANAEELETRVRTLEGDARDAITQIAAVQAKLTEAQTVFASRRDGLIATEIASRRAALEVEFAETRNKYGRAQAEAAALDTVIAAAVPGEDYSAAERQRAAARARAAELATARQDVITRAVAASRVVVGIPGALDADPVFAAYSDEPPFGLLILDRAEELPEPEFIRLAELAERWVLVGDAAPPAEQRPLHARGPTRNGRRPEVSFVTRLAKHLDRELWTTEGDRFVSRLVHLTPEQRRGMSREPLADRPEIELRFAACDGDPLLAEIAFPPGTAVPGAKGFLFHALGEVLLRPCGELHWQHDLDAIRATWPTADAGGESVWIDLEPGVREKIIGAGLFAFTAAVSFDPAAGWDAEKAEAWLANRLPPPATGRLAILPRSPGPRLPA